MRVLRHSPLSTTTTPSMWTDRLGWTGGLQLGTATAAVVAAAPMTSLLAASLSAAGWLADANLVNNKSGIPINSGQDSSTHIVDVNDDGDTKDKRVYRSRARMCVAYKKGRTKSPPLLYWSDLWGIIIIIKDDDDYVCVCVCKNVLTLCKCWMICSIIGSITTTTGDLYTHIMMMVSWPYRFSQLTNL